jgi:hypothetical protein
MRAVAYSHLKEISQIKGPGESAAAPILVRRFQLHKVLLSLAQLMLEL